MIIIHAHAKDRFSFFFLRMFYFPLDSLALSHVFNFVQRKPVTNEYHIYRFDLNGKIFSFFLFHLCILELKCSEYASFHASRLQFTMLAVPHERNKFFRYVLFDFSRKKLWFDNLLLCSLKDGSRNTSNYDCIRTGQEKENKKSEDKASHAMWQRIIV